MVRESAQKRFFTPLPRFSSILRGILGPRRGKACAEVVFTLFGPGHLVDPGQAGVKSGGDGDEASKGGLKKGEEDVHEAPVLRARSPVANDAQDEDDDSKTESALHRDSSEGDLPDVRVLLAVNIARGSHENDGHNLCVSFVSKERRERETETEKRG